MSYTHTNTEKCKAVLQIHLKEIKKQFFNGQKTRTAIYKGEYPNGQENMKRCSTSLVIWEMQPKSHSKVQLYNHQNSCN